MKEFYRKTFLFVGAFTLLAPISRVYAEKSTPEGKTLEAIVSEALESNPELQFYKAEIAAAKGDLKNVRTLANPEAGVEVGHKRVKDSGLVGEGAAWRVSVAQSFEFPGRIALRKAIANRQIELANLGYAQFKAALTTKVRSLGHSLFIAQQKATAANEAAKRGEELVDILVQRDPAGVTPLLETRIIEANVITLRRKATEATKASQAILFDLNQLRGKPVASDLRVVNAEVALPKLPAVDDLVSAAFTNNFELRMRQVEFAQQGIKVDLARKERWSAVTVEPFYSQEKALDTERIIGVGVSMPLPLWNRNTGNIETAKARREQAETSVELAKRQLERDLRGHVLGYETELAEIRRLSPKALDQLREAAELADRHYRLGSLPVSTYVELQTQYVEALEAILETKQDALESLQQLELLTGVRLSHPEGSLDK